MRRESRRNNTLPGIGQYKLRRALFPSVRRYIADSIPLLSLVSATENDQSADCQNEDRQWPDGMDSALTFQYGL